MHIATDFMPRHGQRCNRTHLEYLSGIVDAFVEINGIVIEYGYISCIIVPSTKESRVIIYSVFDFCRANIAIYIAIFVPTIL